MTTYYKVLGADGQAVHGGIGKWFLPVGNRPGKWMPRIDGPSLCERGYHVTVVDNLSRYLTHARLICIVEIRGMIVEGQFKLATEQARIVKTSVWDDRSARLFAADCAERVLRIFEAQYPGDLRPRRAIATARDFANGVIGREELAAYAAASDAASYAAASDTAASHAAFSASYAASYVASFASYAASYAASSASYAAHAASSSASYAADADAASSASYASYAASSASYAAAYAADADAASFARASERAWQGHRVLHYLDLAST